MKSWKLNESNFTFVDKLKICKFFLSKGDFWTMGRNVEEYERQMAKFVGCKYAVFVSSGSTANMLLAYYLKDNVFTRNKNTVIFPSTTWVTSVSPFIREGFTPKFVDVSLTDFSIDLNQLESYLKRNSKKIACIFITSLLGFTPNINKLKEIAKHYKVKIMLDNCENTLGAFKGKNVSSYFTSTTSTYFGHQLQSVEGGFVFTNSDKERDYFLMYRNHGMVRGVNKNEKYANKNVDKRFDFYLLGNNARNSDINAFIGLQDFKRREEYTNKRRQLYNYFHKFVDSSILNLSSISVNKDKMHVPFCLPLIFKNRKNKESIQEWCDNNKIETRPIISGNLLRQTCFKKYGQPLDFKNSENLHTNGFYVGLHKKVKEKDINRLIKQINNL